MREIQKKKNDTLATTKMVKLHILNTHNFTFHFFFSLCSRNGWKIAQKIKTSNARQFCSKCFSCFSRRLPTTTASNSGHHLAKSVKNKTKKNYFLFFNWNFFFFIANGYTSRCLYTFSLFSWAFSFQLSNSFVLLTNLHYIHCTAVLLFCTKDVHQRP